MNQMDYAEAWLWTHFLLETTPERLELVRAYLQSLRSEETPVPISQRCATCTWITSASWPNISPCCRLRGMIDTEIPNGLSGYVTRPHCRCFRGSPLALWLARTQQAGPVDSSGGASDLRNSMLSSIGSKPSLASKARAGSFVAGTCASIRAIPSSCKWRNASPSR